MEMKPEPPLEMIQFPVEELRRLLESNKRQAEQITLLQNNNTKLVGQRRILKKLLKQVYVDDGGCGFCGVEANELHAEDCAYRLAMDMT